MGGFLALIKLALKLLELIELAVVEGKKKLEEIATTKRRKAVADAIEQAKQAKTIDEKRKAACAIEKTVSPDSRCDASERSE